MSARALYTRPTFDIGPINTGTVNSALSIHNPIYAHLYREQRVLNIRSGLVLDRFICVLFFLVFWGRIQAWEASPCFNRQISHRM